MHGAIAWFARNHGAANLRMVVIIAAGIFTMFNRIPLEVFPSFERDIINVSATYAGAAPNEVEEGVIRKIEESVADIPEIDCREIPIELWDKEIGNPSLVDPVGRLRQYEKGARIGRKQETLPAGVEQIIPRGQIAAVCEPHFVSAA